MDSGIKVGGGPDPQSVEQITRAIMQILGSGADQKTLRKALDVLDKSCSTSNVTISGNSIIDGNGPRAAMSIDELDL